MSSTPGEAARLTAIAERLKECAQFSTGGFHAIEDYDDLGFLSAHVETLTQQVAELTKQCVHGHKTRQVGCVSCVMVFDWPLQARAEAAEMRVSELEGAVGVLQSQRHYEQDRAEQAEQQRDAAHAALKRFGRHDKDCDSKFPVQFNASCTCGLDAALAASAPQKEQLHCQFCGADHLPYTCPKRPYSCCGRADPHEHGFGSAIPMPAPAQETERGR